MVTKGSEEGDKDPKGVLWDVCCVGSLPRRRKWMLRHNELRAQAGRYSHLDVARNVLPEEHSQTPR